MNVREAFAALSLDLFSDEWIESVWSTNFSASNSLPQAYEAVFEETDYRECFINIIDALKAWSPSLDTPGPSTAVTDKSWVTLLRWDVNQKALLCLINIFLKSEYPENESRLTAITAARLYVNLLSIHGATVLNVFNIYLYVKVLDLLKFANICDGFSAKKNKNRKSTSDDSESDQTLITAAEIRDLIFELGGFLNEFSICLSCIPLKEEHDALTVSIQSFVNLTKLETEKDVILATNLPRNSLSYLTQKAYTILEQLCCEAHGDVRKTIMYLVGCLLPRLIVTEEDSIHNNSEQSPLKKHSYSFILRLLQTGDGNIQCGVLALVQQLCLRFPEKAQYRSKTVLDIIHLVDKFPPDLYQKIVLWIVCFAHSDTNKHRQAAPELLFGLINSLNKIKELEESQKNIIRRTLFAAIASRISDVSAMVRAKSLEHVAKLISSQQTDIKSIVREIVFPEHATSRLNDSFFNFQEFLRCNPRKFPTDPLPKGEHIMKICDSLVKDSKVSVRKYAIQAQSNMFLKNEEYITNGRLKIFVERCKDCYVSIRSAVAKCLSELVLFYPANDEIISAWVDGVLLLTVENDIKAMENICTLVKDVIIGNITLYNQSQTPISKLPWKLINLISRRGKKNLLCFACVKWDQQKHLTNELYNTLRSHIGTENNQAVWYFFVCISQSTTIPNADFISEYYLTNIFCTPKVSEYLCLLVLEALFLNWKAMSGKTLALVYSNFKSVISEFKVYQSSIFRAMDFCYQYNTKETKEWCGQLVKMCESYLEENMYPGRTGCIEETSLCRRLCTLGIAFSFHPGIQKSTIEILGNLVFSSLQKDSPQKKWRDEFSVKVKSVALITLAKACLQEEILAKKYTPLFSRLLSHPNTPVLLKKNSTSVLRDLCVRYTSVVEEHLGTLCVLLRDRSLEVRIHTLKTLISLIQENYIKVKSPIIFHLLIMLLDSNKCIRDLVDDLMANILMKSVQKLMSKYFVHAIFFYNNYEDESQYTLDGLSPIEKIVFSLSGVNNLNNRGSIYRYMLKHMTDDERFQTCNRICIDIIEKVCDDKILLNVQGLALLKDALQTIAYEEMRLETLRKTHVEKETETEVEDKWLGFAQRTMLSKIVKNNLAETILPLFVKLKAKLTELKSPLLNDTMKCLHALIKDYKDEIDVLLAEHPVLAKEVAFDLKNDLNEQVTVADVEMKELQIHCERLTETFLLKEFGILLNSYTTVEESPKTVALPTSDVPSTSTSQPGTPVKRLRAQSTITPSQLYKNPERRRLSTPNPYVILCRLSASVIYEKTNGRTNISLPVDSLDDVRCDSTSCKIKRKRIH